MVIELVNSRIYTAGGLADLASSGVIQHRPVIVRREAFDVDVDVVRFFLVVGRRLGAAERQRQRLQVEQVLVVGPRAQLEAGHPRVAAELVSTADDIDSRLNQRDASTGTHHRLRVAVNLRLQPASQQHQQFLDPETGLQKRYERSSSFSSC